MLTVLRASRSKPDAVREGSPYARSDYSDVIVGLLSAGCQGTYSQNPPIAAQSANLVCAGYVMGIGTPTFSDCVTYQESRNLGQSVPPYRMDQYSNWIDAEGYRVDSMGRRMSVQSPYDAPKGLTFSSGRTVLRDEYGDRYDSRGNPIR